MTKFWHFASMAIIALVVVYACNNIQLLKNLTNS
jgi:hypothetical protein